ncbi:MAG: PAS domain S-box protein [Gammaproteobacteria bacterium]|nr:PAS domain S-box protein [Gammaproteobacteria bacterium]
MESETNFRRFFDQVQDVLLVVDSRGGIIQANQYAIERLGYSRDELIGMSVLQLHPQERRDEASAIVADMLKGKAERCFLPLLTRSGQSIPAETSSVAGEWNGAPALLCVSRDLSHLTASEEKFSKAFQHSPIAVAITELDSGVYIEVNSAFCQVTGYSPEEVIGKSSTSLGIVLDPRQRDQIVDEVRRHGVANDKEVSVRTKDGLMRHGLFNAALLELQDRQVLITQMLDITDRKAAESGLRENEALLRAALNSTADGILVIGHDGRVITANRRFQTLWGIPDELLRLGDDEKLLAFVLDQLETPQAFIDEVTRLYSTEETSYDRLHFKDGKVFERYTVPLQLPRGLGRVWSFRDVTLREEALYDLQQERGFLKTLVQTIPDLVWLKDPDGAYLACNPKFEELYGASEAEILGRTDYEFVDKELADFFRVNDKAAMSADHPRRNEEWLTFKSSGYRGLFETTKTPMYRADHKLIGVLGIAHDITAARQAEQAIREIEARRGALMDISLDGIAVIDQEHRVIEANARFCNMLGYSREEILTLHTWDWEANFSEEEIRRNFDDLTKVEGRFETRHRRKDGTIYDVEVSAAGREVGGTPLVFTISRDITESKKAVQNLRAQRDLFSGGPTMVFNWLPLEGWPVEFCSANIEQILGYPSERLMRGDIRYTSLIHPDDMPMIDEEVRGHLAAGTDTFEQVYRLRHADGRFLTFYDYSRIQRDASDQVLMISGYLLDITRQRETEQEQLRMERELQQTRKMEALGQLTGGVAHEFNNMLAIMLGHAGLLRNRLGAGANPRFTGYIDHIEQAGSRARDLISQMLAFSRPQDKRPERIALKPAVQEAITLTRGSLPSSIDVRYSPLSGLPDVSLDVGELQQVLTNLLVNARDAMAGKGRIEVGLEWYRDEGGECHCCHSKIQGEWVQISVGDNGSGIAADDLPRILEPFYTTKAVGKGTGLGLSVVQGIVKHSGGHILVETATGAGTRFRLLFPPLAWEGAQPGSAAQSEGCEPSFRGRVLLVDDEPGLLAFMEELLVDQGLEVTACGDGREALSLLMDEGQEFELLITDQTMPGLLGTELAAEAKAHLPGLKVMLCTGHSEQVNAGNAKALGIDHFLPKPVDPKVLRNGLSDLLG